MGAQIVPELHPTAAKNAVYIEMLFTHAPNRYLPYHNLRHIMFVVEACLGAIVHYGKRLTEDERNALFIAAVFHDFGHTGKPDESPNNIELAVDAMKKLLRGEDRHLEPIIEMLIRSTKYPHQDIEAPLLVGILRDADRMQVFEIDWLDAVVRGLADEWGIAFHEMLHRQITFLDKLSFYTDWARKTCSPERIAERKRQVEEQIALLEQCSE